MGMRDRMYELTAVEEVDEFMKQFPTGAFFKAGSCHKTMQGFGYVEQALNPRDNIHVGFVKVVQCRPVSNYIAEITGVIHQSPQLILFINRKPVYDVDNWDITPQALETALNLHLGPVSPKLSAAMPNKTADASRYISLLDQLLKKELSEQEFRSRWLITFQRDAEPRSTEQFQLLNSLFGDVDAALSQPLLGSPRSESPLFDRAAQLLKALQ